MASYSLQTPEWLVFLRTLCALAEGAAKLAVDALEASAPAAAACVLTVLSDLQCRVAAMGGREAMPRSLGSVYGGSVTRFLGGFRGGAPRVISLSSVVRSFGNGIAVSTDGSMLLVSDEARGVLHVVSVHTGVILQTIGSCGSGTLQFRHPCQVGLATDGFVFVADCDNDRIQILTPRYDFHAFVGVGQLKKPQGVCANEDVIVVSERDGFFISVFGRNADTLIRRFDCAYTNYSLYDTPKAVCFVSGHRQVAIVCSHVCVFTVDGEFVRNVGRGELWSPLGVACSGADELVVADWLNDRVVLFSASGEIVWTSSVARVVAVAIHGNSILGRSHIAGKCVVFT